MAPQAHWMSVALSQRPPRWMRRERWRPALSSRRGERRAQERRWPAGGKRLMSVPISARMTGAAVGLTPGTGRPLAKAARKGAKAVAIASARARQLAAHGLWAGVQ